MTYTRNKRAEQVLKNSINSVEDLAALDDDKSGGVSELEFLKHMLVKTNACKQREIDAILEQFRNLDVDGSGHLDAADFARMNQEKEAKRQSIFASLERVKTVGQHQTSKSTTNSGLSDQQLTKVMP